MIFERHPIVEAEKNIYSNAKTISYLMMVLIIKRTLSEMKNGLINRDYLDIYFKFISKFPHKKQNVLNFKFSAFLLLACFRII